MNSQDARILLNASKPGYPLTDSFQRCGNCGTELRIARATSQGCFLCRGNSLATFEQMLNETPEEAAARRAREAPIHEAAREKTRRLLNQQMRDWEEFKKNRRKA